MDRCVTRQSHSAFTYHFVGDITLGISILDITSFLLGVGLAVLGAFGTGFLKKAGEDFYAWLRRKINPKVAEEPASHLILHVRNDEVSEVREGSSLERINIVSADEISAAIESAPPLQRKQVSDNYVGLHVEWETTFVAGDADKDGKIRLFLRARDSKTTMGNVWCEVSASEYRELGILPANAEIRIYGEIAKIGNLGIDIKDARLHIYKRA